MRQTKTEIMEGILDVVNPKLVGNNTVEYWVKGGDRVIRYHNTDILKFKPSGEIVFNTGGWRTTTTKDRLNCYQNEVMIWSEHRVWYAIQPKSNYSFNKEGAVVFADGMIYSPEHGFLHCGNLVGLKRQEKDIRAYAKKCVDAMPLPSPSNGDCWYCLLKDKDGKSMGEANGDHRHLISHVKDGYVVPSLIWNVLLDKGCDPQGGGSIHFAAVFDKNDGPTHDFYVRKQYVRWIYDYMYARIVHNRK